MNGKTIELNGELLTIDEFGFGLTEHVVAVYSDLMNNRDLVARYWPYSKLDPTTRLQRFTTVENLKKMIRTRTNYLANVLTWPDVYEGFTRNIKLEDQGHNEIDWSSMTTSFYGQCWTTTPFDSELLWNARCSKDGKNGVCIRTTFGKLVCSFLRGIGMGALGPNNMIARCGKIEYLNEVDFAVEFAHLVRSIQNSSGLDLTSPRMLDLLMVKRQSFSDENEIRIVVDGSSFRGGQLSHIKPNVFSFNSPGFSYSVKPDDFIDEILIDPRIPKIDAERITADLRFDLQRFGWSYNGRPIDVCQSDLYDYSKSAVTIALNL